MRREWMQRIKSAFIQHVNLQIFQTRATNSLHQGAF